MWQEQNSYLNGKEDTSVEANSKLTHNKGNIASH